MSRIGDQRNPSQIIEAINTPNATVTEGSQSYVVLTVDGLVVTGVLVSQSASEVVLAVPDKGEVRIPPDDIEEMQKGKSAMPDDVVKELANEQEFYDLIAFLATRKASAMGTPVVVTNKVLLQEVPVDGQSLPLLAVARPGGMCYLKDRPVNGTAAIVFELMSDSGASGGAFRACGAVFSKRPAPPSVAFLACAQTASQFAVSRHAWVASGTAQSLLWMSIAGSSSGEA